jgi:hypothetical protein
MEAIKQFPFALVGVRCQMVFRTPAGRRPRGTLTPQASSS